MNTELKFVIDLKKIRDAQVDNTIHTIAGFIIDLCGDVVIEAPNGYSKKYLKDVLKNDK